MKQPRRRQRQLGRALFLAAVHLRRVDSGVLALPRLLPLPPLRLLLLLQLLQPLHLLLLRLLPQCQV